MQITDQQLEELGKLADQASNLIAASTIPMPSRIHIAGMREGLKEIEEKLKAIYTEVSGENPWEDEPAE